MSVLDRLIVELQLDPKKFSGPTKKAVEDLRTFEKQAGNTGNSLEGVGKKGADALAGVRREALAMLAVFTAGKSLKAFMSDTTKANMQLDYMSQRLNMDPGGLARLETAAKAAGGTFGEVGQTLDGLQKKLGDPEQWGGLTRIFSQLGVPDFQDKDGNIRTDIIAAINKGAHDNHVSNANIAALMGELGFGAGAINQAEMDPAKFKALQNQLKGMIVPTKEMTEQSRQLYQDWVILQQQSESLTSTFTSKMNPALDEAVKRLIELEKHHPDIAGSLGIIKFAADEAAKSFGNLGGIITAYLGLKTAKGLFGAVSKGPGLFGRLYNAGVEGIAALGERGTAAGAAEVAGGAVLSRLLGFGATIGAGLSLNSDINSSRKDMNELAKAVQKGSSTNSPLFGVMAASVAGIEHASYGQMGGSSGKYAGRYQMSPDAIKEAAGQLGETAPTQDTFLRDPAMQERYFKAYTKQNEWYLLRHNEQFRAMNDAQKLSVLAYAHNQGAAGADKWLRTGVDGKDAFGTSGALYAQNTMNNIGGYAASQSTQAEQASAVKRLADTQAALKQQMNQSPRAIGTDPSAQLAARATPGGNGSGNTTTNNATNFHGDIVINTQATDGKGVVDAFKDHFNRRSILAVNSPGLQ